MGEDQDLSNSEEYYEVKVCTGDWLQGLSIDILEYCDIGELSTEQKRKLWDKYTDISLMSSCDDCFLIKTGELDEVPGQSTEFFSVMTDNEDQLRAEIRDKIMEVINK